jgi:hypothetical protein
MISSHKENRQMKAVALLSAMAMLGAAHAADVRPLVKAGFDLGGETMVNVVFTNGDTQKVRGNEGFYLGGGAAIINDAKDWEYQVTAAYKFALIDAENGDVEWTRIPLEALAFYRWQRARLGGGLTYHLSPKLEGSGVVGGLNVKFKNALGVIVQSDWRITENIALGGRFTFLEYDAKAPASGSAKANGFGITFSMNF